MAMSITHQIATLAGTPIVSETSNNSSGESTATAAILKISPPSTLRCKVQKPEVLDATAVSPPLSPCRSPVLGGIRPVACRALTREREEIRVNEYKEGGETKKGKGEGGVPVYVMMPLDSVTMGNTVNRKKAMKASLQALKSAGVEGIMMDVWWGLVERERAGEYNWGGYIELMEMAEKFGLKVQAVMSFHHCGGNVGDSCKLYDMYIMYSTYK